MSKLPPMNRKCKSTSSSSNRALIFSPANALAFSLLGYYSMAGLVNVYLPDSNLGGILLRGLIGVVVLVALARFFRYGQKIRGAYLYPAAIFLLLYFFRMYENAFIVQLTLPPNNEVAFLIFLASIVIPAISFTLIAGQIDDRQFDVSMRILLVIFGVSLFLNLQDLLASYENRLSLAKINPISMSITAYVFLLYHLLRFRQSKFLMIQSAIAVPLLLLVILYARSRGVYIAGAATLVIYGICLKGSRRVSYLLGLGLFALAAATWFAGDAVEIIIKSIERIFSGTDLSANTRRDAGFGGWEQFLQDPVIGRYIIELSHNYYVHNMYLESLMAVGVVGTLFLVLHLVLAFRAVVGIIRSPHATFVARFSSPMFVFMSIIAASSSSVYLAIEFWITSFLVIAFWYGRAGFRQPSYRPVKKTLESGLTGSTRHNGIPIVGQTQ